MSKTDLPKPGHEISALERVLLRLRAAIRVHLLVQRVGVIVAWVVGCAIAVGVLDYLVRLPQALRVVVWLAGAGACVWALRRRVWPVMRFRPSLTDLALRVEQSPIGRRSGWGGVLASGLELSRGVIPEGAGSDELHERLSRACVEVARTKFGRGPGIPGLLDNHRLRGALLGLVVTGIVLAGLAMASTEHVRVGTRRVLTPWSSAQWPKRTGVMHAGTPTAHPKGVALPLRAALIRSNTPSERTRVLAHYRVVGTGSEQRAILTRQGAKVSVSGGVGAPSVEGELFESLLDTRDLANTGSSDEQIIELWFSTIDDETEPLRIALVTPPGVSNAKAQVEPPEYAKFFDDAAILKGERELGDGLDGRAVIGPVLAGSRVSLELEWTKDVLPPRSSEPEESRAWLMGIAPVLADQPGITCEATSRGARVTFLAKESVRASVTLMDRHMIASREPSLFRIDVIEDRPPSASVIEPAQDEAVLASAVIPLTGEGRDDLGLAWAALRAQVAKGDPNSAGAPPVVQGEPAELSRWTQSDPSTTPPRVGTTRSLLDLSTLNLRAGDEVWVTARSQDVLGASGGEREPAVSPVRRLRVISDSELVEQFRGELTSLRDAARQLEREQSRLHEEGVRHVSQDASPSGEAARQGAISRRMDPFRQSLARLSQRAERNKLDDEALRGLLQDAGEAAREAQEASRRAEQALEQLPRTGDARARDALRGESLEQQERAARALSELSEMLGDGQDDWAVRRSLEKLLAEQKQIRAQTETTGSRTDGRDAASLPSKDREELERLARRQEELSQRAAQALDTLEQRAQQMQQSDSAQARAMQQAASRARSRQLVQRQSQAGQQLRQNKTGQAQQSQRQAERAIEEALENLDNVQQARDEQLRRVLADVIESIDQLIAQQEAELTRLARAQGGAPADALDTSLIKLHQNTLGVLKKVRDEVRGGEKLAGLLDGAQSAQSAGVVALRTRPADLPEADAMERLSLSRLREAREEAESMQNDAEQRVAERARRELRKAYQEMLELQVALRAEGDPLTGVEVTRRVRQQLRELAQRQESIRDRMNQVRSQTEGFEEARVFEFAHTRFDRAAAEVVASFREGVASRATQRQLAALVAILESQVAALKEANPEDDGLQDDAGGGGGGSGQGGQGQKPPAIPPYAELVLLRGMQAEAAARTRAAGEQGAGASEIEDVAKLQDDLAREGEALLGRLKQERGMQPPLPAGDVRKDDAEQKQTAREEDGADENDSGGGGQ